eukprot:COSAG05_NODE_5385_length_1191_cov_2.015568_1_plen_213_part_00
MGPPWPQDMRGLTLRQCRLRFDVTHILPMASRRPAISCTPFIRCARVLRPKLTRWTFRSTRYATMVDGPLTPRSASELHRPKLPANPGWRSVLRLASTSLASPSIVIFQFGNHHPHLLHHLNHQRRQVKCRRSLRQLSSRAARDLRSLRLWPAERLLYWRFLLRQFSSCCRSRQQPSPATFLPPLHRSSFGGSFSSGLPPIFVLLIVALPWE